MVAMGGADGLDLPGRPARRRAVALPDEGSRRCADRCQRGRALRLYADQVRRLAAMAPVPEVRPGLPEDLRGTLVPLPPMLRAGLRLDERTGLPARYRSGGQDRQTAARQVGRCHRTRLRTPTAAAPDALEDLSAP